ncbi:hypothetical protein GH714_039075 [Hevea brasiliensis]|uniref:U2A'/phosphoprotein 32 family A C-terminal domain-containing protein n=1 Tax=Hevea brasiliensis TaxID=3981 RepID=A0A6A6K8X6_HEVBR|nr:hypothetical protein GH714_039075 [Hevea brasiliensis]
MDADNQPPRDLNPVTDGQTDEIDPSSTELVLRDNKLKKIPDVSIFKSLLVFDVSFNEIGSSHGLSNVSSTLKELYVSKNEVTNMEKIDQLYQLQILELGSNRLRISTHIS